MLSWVRGRTIAGRRHPEVTHLGLGATRVIAVLLLVRAESRHRVPALLALALLVAIVAAVLVAGTAGARRTASVLERFDERTVVSDVEVLGLSPALAGDPAEGVELAEALSAVEGVDGAAVASGFPLGVSEEEYFMVYSSLDGSMYTAMDRPLVDEGRLPAPDAPDEIAINRGSAEDLGLEVGDVVTGPTLTPEGLQAVFTTGEFEGFVGLPLELRVVGLITRGRDLPDRASSFGTHAIASPAFAATYGDEVGSYVTEVHLRSADPSPALLRQLTDAAQQQVGEFEIDVTTVGETWRDSASDTYHTLALIITAFTALAAAAGLLVLLQALSREVSMAGRHDPVARGLGMTRRARVGVAAVPALMAVGVGLVVGLLLGLSASGLFPVGRALDAEVDPGISLDSLAVLATVVIVLAVAGAWTLRAAWRTTGVGAESARLRPSPVVKRLARLGARPPAIVGVRMAFERGTGANRPPVRTAVVGAVVAVAAVTAVLVVARSADAVAADPARYGWAWSTVPDSLSDDPEAAAGAAGALDGVAGVGPLSFSTVEVGGAPLPAAALETTSGSMALTVAQGRLPATDSEIALAPGTAADLGVGIGEELAVDDPAGGAPRSLSVVGTVVAPPVDDVPRVAVLSAEGLTAVAQSEPAVYTAIRYEPAADQAEVEAALEGLGYRFTRSSRPIAPSEVEQVRAVHALLVALVVLLAVLGAVGLLHFLATSIRRRAGDLAVLKALGFVRRDIRRSVVWQAVAAVGAGLAFGIPTGVVVGRVAWLLVVGPLDIIDDPATPWALGALVIAVSLAGGAVLGVGPGWVASHRRTVEVLRGE